MYGDGECTVVPFSHCSSFLSCSQMFEWLLTAAPAAAEASVLASVNLSPTQIFVWFSQWSAPTDVAQRRSLVKKKNCLNWNDLWSLRSYLTNHWVTLKILRCHLDAKMQEWHCFDSQFWIVAYFEKNSVCTHCICVGFSSGTVYTAHVRWSGPSQLLTGVNSPSVMEYLTAP